MNAVADPVLSDFYDRIARIQSARARGLGFEAPGLIGRSHYRRRQRRRFSLMRSALWVLVAVTMLKAVIHERVGDETYRARVAELASSAGIDRLGGVVMMADPVTLWLSSEIARRF
jgi:hypothetical protein